MRIYVGNLNFSTGDDELRAAFEQFGDVVEARVAIDRYSQRSRGFGFVEMPDAGQAQSAIAGLNGTELAGRTLNVNEARPREDRGGYR